MKKLRPRQGGGVPVGLIIGLVLLVGCDYNTKPVFAVKPPVIQDKKYISLPLLSDEEIMVHYHRYAEGLELFKGLEDIEAKMSKPGISKKERAELDNRELVTIERPRHISEMTIDGKTGGLSRLSNAVLYEKQYVQEETRLPKHVKATRNKEEILQLAQQYLVRIEELSGKINAKLKLAGIKFHTQDSNGTFSSGTHRGLWVMHWERMHNGYKFLFDALEMEINDKDGRLQRYAQYISSQLCPINVRISQQRAEKIARKVFVKIKEGSSYHKTFKKISSSKLLIVNPNYSFSDSYDYMADLFGMSQRTRLCWVITLDVDTQNDSGFHIGWSDPQIWIDAENGEVLGGI